MRVICVYKTGGDFDLRYVEALRFATERYLGFGHEFVCLTDDVKGVSSIKGVTAIKLKHNWPGWWSKIELFRPDLSSDNTTIYFDLDVLILKDISEFSRICRRASMPLMLRSCDRVGEANDWPSSSIMSWMGKCMNRVYYEFIKDSEEAIKRIKKGTSRAGQRTDQGFIRQVINPRKFQDLLPKDYIMFKMQYLKISDEEDDPLDYVRILNWTGFPRFHAMNLNFWNIQSIWESRCYKIKIFETSNQLVK